MNNDTTTSSSSEPQDNGVTATPAPLHGSAAAVGMGTTTTTAPSSSPPTKRPFWRINAFNMVLILDLLVSLILLTPVIPWIMKVSGETMDHFTFYGDLVDLSALALVRVVACLLALLVAYCRAEEAPECPFDLYHPNGEKKTREELEEEALEESWWTWLRRYMARPSFSAEILAFATQVLCVIKCMWRLYIEIGPKHGTAHYHPLFWIAIFWTSFLSLAEASFLDSICQLNAAYAAQHPLPRQLRFLRTISSSLSIPLLAAEEQQEGGEQAPAPDVEQAPDGEADVNAVGTSDINADTDYKASWTDLLRVCAPDSHLLCVAFVFLILAAISQTLIPHYLGRILDALEQAFKNKDENSNESIMEVPGFMRNVKLLVLVSVSAGLFSGVRGSIFTFCGGRVNVRLRIQLMDALLAQDIGFFDVTKTGEITSRLSSDTSLVGNQVTLNVNLFLRSMVQAIGVLGFMFSVSWQLTILAFISVPVITMLSRWYGEYVRSLTKLMQKKLADGNAVSEALLSSMRTVRAFDAAESELGEFEKCMVKYLQFTVRASIAYFGYNCVTTSLPQFIFAAVVFYGGLLVRNGEMTSGQLVSFLLYLQSLSDAIADIGYVFSALTQAVGAADKVFELLHRRPRITPPSRSDISAEQLRRHRAPGSLRVDTSQTTQLRLRGIVPETIRGEIELKHVVLYYPSRPKRRVLDNLSLKIEPGSIVALVGQSGGGKSSVMSLIQHLYEPQSGRVLVDGIDVHELCPSWLSRQVSIVSQEPTLFARSIRKNIMYGLEGTDLEPTQEQIEEAARLANADSFIQQMPLKYDTEVGERGVQLSGGQKQRIAIARALVRRPRVLLLDEATSALDAESEHQVQQAIDDMIARGKTSGSDSSMTVVIVAHRLSTVRSADKIFVIKDGRVVEEGNHNELLKNPEGAYASLISRQMEAQQKLEDGPAVVSDGLMT